MAGPGQEEIEVEEDALTPGRLAAHEDEHASFRGEMSELADALAALPDEELLDLFDGAGEMIAQPGQGVPEGMSMPSFLQTPAAPPPDSAEALGIQLPPSLGGEGGMSEEPPPLNQSLPQDPLPSEAAPQSPQGLPRNLEPEETPEQAQQRQVERFQAFHAQEVQRARALFMQAGYNPNLSQNYAQRYVELNILAQRGQLDEEGQQALQRLENAINGVGGGAGGSAALQLALAGQQMGEAQQALGLADRIRNQALLQGAERLAQDVEAGIPSYARLNQELGDLGRQTEQEVFDLDNEIERNMIGLDRQIRDLSQTRVDPAAFFTSRGSAATFAAMINVAAGALSSTLLNALIPGTNATNTAMGIIERAVERETEAQLANVRIQTTAIGAQGQLINMLRARTQDAFALQSSMRAVLYGQAEAQLRALGLRSQADEIRVRALDVSNALRVRRLEMLLRALLEQETALRRRAGRGGGRRQRVLEDVLPEAPDAPSFRDRLREEYITAEPGDTRMDTMVVTDAAAFRREYPTLGDEERRQIRGRGMAAQLGADSLREIMDLAGSGTPVTDPTLSERIGVHFRNLSDAVIQGRDGSVITAADAELYSTVVRNPATLFSQAQEYLRALSEGRDTRGLPLHTAQEAVEGLINRADASYRSIGGRHISRVSPEQARMQSRAPNMRVEETLEVE